MKTKQLKVVAAGLISMLALGMGTPVFATAQSRPGVDVAYSTPTDFAYKVRTMEMPGGTLGLNGTVDSKTLLDSTSNGIDVHMSKSTEWGTAMILSASAYGQPSQVVDQTTSTTGNASGVINMSNMTNEFVASFIDGGGTMKFTERLASADSRYVNHYSDNTVLIGDGSDVGGWYGNNYVNTKNGQTERSNIFRLNKWSSYAGVSHYRNNFYLSHTTNSDYGDLYERGSTRAVIVTGQGL